MRVSRLVWADTGVALCGLMASAHTDAVIIAPFITVGAFRHVLDALPESVGLLLITRWNPKEIVDGVSDTGIMDLVAGRPNTSVVLHPLVHAKVYVVDSRRALIGSANVTETALGFSERSNVEVLLEVEPVSSTLLAFVRRLQQESVPASDDLRRKVEQMAERLAPSCSAEEVGFRLPTRDLRRGWYPHLRNPERLYRLYRSVLDAGSRDEYEAALDDLAELLLPGDLEETEFVRAVSRRLSSYPQIREFDEFVRHPRRFGELTEWLKRRTGEDGADHQACQRQIQCLIRWLLFFFPGRYALCQPHYSEVFGWREALHGLRRLSPGPSA